MGLHRRLRSPRADRSGGDLGYPRLHRSDLAVTLTRPQVWWVARAGGATAVLARARRGSPRAERGARPRPRGPWGAPGRAGREPVAAATPEHRSDVRRQATAPARPTTPTVPVVEERRPWGGPGPGPEQRPARVTPGPRRLAAEGHDRASRLRFPARVPRPPRDSAPAPGEGSSSGARPAGREVGAGPARPRHGSHQRLRRGVWGRGLAKKTLGNPSLPVAGKGREGETKGREGRRQVAA